MLATNNPYVTCITIIDTIILIIHTKDAYIFDTHTLTLEDNEGFIFWRTICSNLAHTHIHTHTHTYTHTHTHTHTYRPWRIMWGSSSGAPFALTGVLPLRSTRLSVCVCMCVYVYVCVCVCMCVGVYVSNI
jgi:hypothetical protein